MRLQARQRQPVKIRKGVVVTKKHETLVELRYGIHSLGYACYPCIGLCCSLLEFKEGIPQEEIVAYSLREKTKGEPLKIDYKEVSCLLIHPKDVPPSKKPY